MGVLIVCASVLVVSFGVLWAGKLLDQGRLAELYDNFKANLDRPSGFRSWVVPALLLLGAFFLLSQTHDPSLGLVLGSLAVLILFARAWGREFLFLMARRDGDFPGRFDKLVWAFLLVAAPPVGLWLFRGYHLAHWPEPAAKPVADRAFGAEPL